MVVGAERRVEVTRADETRERTAAAYDIGNAVTRLKRMKRHPWEGIGAVRQSLPG